jgi:hypothetical protein
MGANEYYYAHDIDTFIFYRIPKALFSTAYTSLDCEAKVLYGLLLDRNGLSKKNAWVDKMDRVFIYFERTEAGELLGVKKEKAIKLFKQLQEFDLIDDVRQGCGKPNRIYVKKPHCEKSEIQTSKKPTSGTRKNRPVEVGKTDRNNNNFSYNKKAIQTQNFEQRKYSDEYYDNLYDNANRQVH